MEKTSKELIYLVRELLFDEYHDFKVTNQDLLYKQASENGLSGCLYEILSSHVDEIDPRFKKDFYLYVAHDQKQVSLINHIKDLLDSKKIEYKFLKGSILKDIYPKSYYRQMGDIDLLIDVNDLEVVSNIITNNGFQLDQKGHVHDHYTYGDLEFELHKRLRTEHEFLEFQVLDRILEDDTYLEMELLFLVFHLKKHLIHGGIGLRSVLDISLYLNYYQDKLDMKKLYELLRTTKTVEFFENLMLFNDEYLGKSLCNTLEINRKMDKELFEVFTEYIILSGIHGLGMSFNNYIGKLANDSKLGIGKKKAFLKQVFLPYNTMKFMYPNLLKIKVFLPLAWGIRIFKVVFLKSRRFKITLKQYQVDQNTIDDTKDLFQKIGI